MFSSLCLLSCMQHHLNQYFKNKVPLLSYNCEFISHACDYITVVTIKSTLLMLFLTHCRSEQHGRSASPCPSHESVRSYQSKDQPWNLKESR